MPLIYQSSAKLIKPSSKTPNSSSNTMMGYFFPLLLALLLFPYTCSADVVLGGVVDYNPTCYGTGVFSVIVEYNGAYNEDDTHNQNINEVLLREKLTDPLGLYNGETFLADSYHKTVKMDGYSNYPITQKFFFTHPDTNMFSISLRKGVRMIRIPFLNEGQAPGWKQGIQIRFTEYTMKQLAEKFAREVQQEAEKLGKNFLSYKFTPEEGIVSSFYDLNVHMPCLIINGAIPYSRRTNSSQLINCLYATAAKHDPNRDPNLVEDPVYNPTVDVDNCDLNTNNEVKKNPPPPMSPEQRLLGYLKDIALIGISHVPYVGAFLAVGIDVLIKYAENKVATEKVLQDAGIDTAKIGIDTIFSSFLEISKTKISH
ncbi:hypothetical protein BG003_011798 [Podila horticola]|nr:hypothetical protein BG003_011798 [Podila horticola]